MKREKIYVPPEILVQKLVVEESISNTSSLIIVTNEDNEILVDDWAQGSDIESPDQDTRW